VPDVPARLHLVDGTYELFRAHFTRGPRRTDDEGVDLTATHGVVRSLLALLDDEHEACTHVAVAFDNPIRSFRNELFAGYKDGEDTDPVLLAQFDLVERVVASLGVVVWSMDEHEADDALATAAVTLRDEVGQVRVMTPDKDLGQVVDGDRIVQVDRSRDRVLDAAGVEERLGVPPAAVVDFLALVGDAADGIPGVPRVGAKTATLLLQRYGSIDAVPEDPDEWDVQVRGAAGIGASIAAHRDDLALWRTLATLVTDVELRPGALADMAVRDPDTATLAAFAERVGSTRLAKRAAGRH
jgi:5'-3' exonuclease